jgi:hypothetical protein
LKGKLKTTSILEEEGKIGRFFLNELIYIVIGLCVLVIVMINLSNLFKIKFVYVIGVPAFFLGTRTVIKYFFIKKTENSWYVYDWLCHRFFWPKSISGGSSSFKRKTK